MAGLVPAIYVLLAEAREEDGDARDKRGHAGEGETIYSSGASTSGSYRLISRPSKFQLCTMWGGSGAVTSMRPPRGCGTAMRRARRCKRFWMPPGKVQFSLLKYFGSPTIGCPIWAR